MKPKFEAQNAHFSERIFTFYCAPVKPDGLQYVYHLSDRTTHASIFAHHILTDIITTRNINSQTIIIQSDDGITQYKNKYAFKYMQNLSDNYKLKIIRIFDAAGHGNDRLMQCQFWCQINSTTRYCCFRRVVCRQYRDLFICD